MKKLSLIIVLLSILTLSISCRAEDDTYAGIELRNKHELLPIDSIRSIVDAPTNSTNKYLLLLPNSNVAFLWYGNKRKINFSSLPINKIRFAYENVTVPYIIFKWSPSYGILEGDMVKIIGESVIYAVVYCNEERFNIKTKLEKE